MMAWPSSMEDKGGARAVLRACALALMALSGLQAAALCGPRGTASPRTGCYLALTLGLACAALVCRAMVRRISAGLGLAVFGWATLACVATMVEVDAGGEPSGMPWVTLAPPVGVLALGVFGTARAMGWYALGCAGVLFRAGMVYDDWGNGWAGVAILAVLVGLSYWISTTLARARGEVASITRDVGRFSRVVRGNHPGPD